MINSSLQFLQHLQNQKKIINDQYKSVKIDLQEMEHRIQTPLVKIQNQRVKISQNQFIYLIKAAKTKFIKQPSLLQIDGPIFISTGTYGSYHQLSLIFQKCGNPKFVNYLFLGDYSGKYNRAIQCLVALLTYKIKFHMNFFLLRGCFQTIQISKSSTLYIQIIEYFGSTRAWIQLCQLYCCLPFAAVINQRIFCVHGGISPYLFTFQQINQINRPFNTPQKGLPHDLVFNELYYQSQEEQSPIQNSTFGVRQTEAFIKRTGIKLICRGHSIVENGFEFVFNKTVINLCSISNYCNEYSNGSAVIMVDDQFNVMFRQISNGLSSKNQQNEEGLTFQQIVERRQQKKIRLQQEEKMEVYKNESRKNQKYQQRIDRQKREQKRKQKQQRRKIRRLKKQMLQQKIEKQNESKLQQNKNQQQEKVE